MPASESRDRSHQGRAGARLYSLTVIAALCGLAVNLALGQWLLAVPFGILLLDTPAPSRSKVLRRRSCFASAQYASEEKPEKTG